jgi:hypothetical protein
MRKALSLISSLCAGSKNRLKQFRSNLKRNYDKRNFDSKVYSLLRKYVRSSWKKELTNTERYLRNLRSSKDGKLFSQGVKDYNKLLAAGQRFAEPNHTYFGWNRHYKEAKEFLIQQFKNLNLRPLQYHNDDDIVKALPKLDTHAGFTYIISGMKEKGENLEDIFARWTQEVDDAIVDGTFGKPILPAVRTQGNGHAFEEDGSFTGDCDHKTRMVSMVDLMVIIAELIFAKPIQDHLATVSWYAGGKDLDGGVSSIITGMRMKYNEWVSLDYSSFDQSISAWLIHDVFDIIKSAFGVLSPREEEIFNLVEHDFIEKDFVFGDEIIHSVRGVPSGSMFTQIVDSICNVLVIMTYFYSKSVQGQMIVMGDDNLIYTVKSIDVDDLADYLKKNFGMTVNSDKTKVGHAFEPPTFLSCEWWPEGRYREPHEIIAKLLYPEREREYHKGDVHEEEVLWSYILMYRVAMTKFLNVEQFLADYPKLRRSSLRTLGSQNLPGLLKYLKEYSGGYWSSFKVEQRAA